MDSKISTKFTLLELTDLALKVEPGAVNFNILHSILSSIITELGLENFKPQCHIENEALAQAAITKARMEDKGARRRSNAPTMDEIQKRMKKMDGQDEPETELGLEDIKQSETEDSERMQEDQGGAQVSIEKGSEDSSVQKEDEDSPAQKEDEDSPAQKEDEDSLVKKDEAPSVEKEGEVSSVEESKGMSPPGEDRSKEAAADVSEALELPKDMTVEEMQDTARDLLDKSADAFVEKVSIVTDALKVLEDEDLLDSEPEKVMEELWRATNINRRMDSAEAALTEFSSILDMFSNKIQDLEDESADVLAKTRSMIEEISKFIERLQLLDETCINLGLRIDDCNEKRAYEVERLEGIINDLMREMQETKSALEDLESSHKDLAERVAYKEDLEELKSQMSEELETKLKEMRRLLREVEDTLVKKDDFMELVTRVEEMEETKVNRDELGRLLEPGFIDRFLDEQENLRKELDELKITVAELQEEFAALHKRMDEIVKTMEAKFADVNSELKVINEKLALLDADEINDTFANLEEQDAMIIKELEEMKAAFEKFMKEARLAFGKISNVNDLLLRLEQTKADKSRMYELLATKADIDMLLSKLDRSEFEAVVGEMNDRLERLIITVKINEEEMNHNFLEIRHEITLKMYTEDFITATEPIRNRIKAILQEQERVKEIALTHLFPDAPGIAKCLSCNRGANLAGPKYLGDAHVELLQEIPERTTRINKIHRPGTSQKSPDEKFPPADLDTVPIPPLDHPRETDASRLPVLFASMRPQIGLAHEKRRKDIDADVSAYFTLKPQRPCGGEYTRTLPQQRGLAFTAVKLSQAEKEDVLLKGIDQKYYKGALYDGQFIEDGSPPLPEEKVDEKSEPAKDAPTIASLKEPRVKKGFKKPDTRPRPKKTLSRDEVKLCPVSLQVADETLPKTELHVNIPMPSDAVTEDMKSSRK